MILKIAAICKFSVTVCTFELRFWPYILPIIAINNEQIPTCMLYSCMYVLNILHVFDIYSLLVQALVGL